MHCILVDGAKICKNIYTLQCIVLNFTKKLSFSGGGVTVHARKNADSPLTVDGYDQAPEAKQVEPARDAGILLFSWLR